MSYLKASAGQYNQSDCSPLDMDASEAAPKSVAQKRLQKFSCFRTAKKRRITVNASKRQQGKLHAQLLSKEEIVKGCADFVAKIWIPCACTPMFNCSVQQFAYCTDSLVLHLVKSTGKHSKYFNVKFEIKKGIAITSGDSEAIKISVYSKENVLLEAYFCSVGSSITPDSVVRSDSDPCFLPLVLYSGDAEIWSVIKGYITTEFGCYISKLTFNPISLKWMLGMWADTTVKELSIMWQNPISNTGLDHVEATIKADIVSKLWRSIRRSAKNVIESAEVAQFVDVIEKHFYQVLHVKVQDLQISAVGLEVVRIENCGKILIHDEGKAHVHSILAHLTCLASEIVDWKRYVPTS